MHRQVYLPLVKTIGNQVTLTLLLALQRHKESSRGDDDSDSDISEDGAFQEDPVDFETFETAMSFISDAGRGIPGGGNKDADAIIPNR